MSFVTVYDVDVISSEEDGVLLTVYRGWCHPI
jgi:hypothetical protein